MMSQLHSKKSRLMLSAGMFVLAASLILFTQVHPATSTAKDWLDGISGFLMGISIALNLGSILVARRQRSSCASM
jgi:hypothetical protein